MNITCFLKRNYEQLTMKNELKNKYKINPIDTPVPDMDNPTKVAGGSLVRSVPGIFSTYTQAGQGQAGSSTNPAGHLNKGLEAQINMNLERNRRPILILGIGNILLRDEGVGVHVIEKMQNTPLPEDVELVDGGTAGVDLLDMLAERKKVIVIDAVQADCEPGTILRFTADELTQPDRIGMSLHELGLGEALKMTKQLGCAPQDVVVFGIKPKDISCGLELSEQIAESIPKVVELVAAEIAK